MAITWGAWSSDNRLRCGVEVTLSPSTVTHSTSSVTATAKVYMQTRFASSESGTNITPWNMSGSWSDSGYGNGWSLGDMGTKLLGTSTHSFAPQYGSSSNGVINGSFTSSFAYPGTSASSSQSFVIPERPIAAPATPTGCAWSRTSDTQHTVTWTNTSPTDASAPYQNVSVQRMDDDGDWVRIAKLGVVSSYTDTGTSANHKYQYRVFAQNTAGNSGYSTSSAFYTTPAKPTNCTATKTAAGDITVTWSDPSPYNNSYTLWHATNGVWDGTALATITPGSTTTYTHVSPSTTVTHQYRLTSHVSIPALDSAFSTASNVVALTAPPNAPTNLTPNGAVRDAASVITYTWLHNPVDTTPQTAREFRYQVNGGSFASTGKSTTSVQSRTGIAGEFTNGTTLGWQVRTWGAATTGGSDGTGASPWSATATITLATAPTVVVNTPSGPTARSVTDGHTTASSTTVTSATAAFTSNDVGATISGGSIPAGATIVSVTNATTVVISAAATVTSTTVTLTITDVNPVITSTLVVTWGYAQAEGSPQAQWRATLYDASGNVLEIKSGSGTDSTTTMATALANSTTYKVGVSVQSSTGLWSTEDVNTFSVAYALPPTPTISALWMPDDGAVSLSVDCPDPVSPQVAADHLQVWRQIDATTWALVADNVDFPSSVSDYIPSLCATNTYMCVAVSALPSVANSTTVSVDTTPGCHHVWVNAGQSFSQRVCFTTSVDIGVEEGTQKALNEYAGRTKPVETSGEQTEQIITIRAVKYDDLVASPLAAETSEIADIAALAKLPAPACVRTPDGMRVFVSMAVPTFGGLGTAKVRSVTWTLVEVDYTEPTGS